MRRTIAVCALLIAGFTLGSATAQTAVGMATLRPAAAPAARYLYQASSARTASLHCIDGLVGWWQGNGNARDSACGHNGLLRGPVTFGPGVSGKAFSFSGAQTTVRVPQTPAFNVGAAVSLDFWFKGAPGNAMNTCCQGLVTTDFYGIELSAGRENSVGINFFVSTDDGASSQHTSDLAGGGYTLAPGKWIHVAGIYDGRRLRLYVNDRLVATTPHTGAISPMRSTSFLSIGSEDGRSYYPSLVGTRYFQGLIGAVKIYHRAIR